MTTWGLYVWCEAILWFINIFRSNAWNVEISREDYSEHDVANVLKRFVRQLDEPLLTDVLRQSFLTVSRIQDQVSSYSYFLSMCLCLRMYTFLVFYYPSFYLFMYYLSVHLSIYPYIYSLQIHPSILTTIHPSIKLFI